MTEWKAGDLAMCLIDDWENVTGSRPAGIKSGQVYLVCEVVFTHDRQRLVLTGYEGSEFQSDGFRKVRPSAVAEVAKLRALLDVPAGARS